MSTPVKSTLYLCKGIDLDPNYNYTMDFNSLQAQADYFDTKIDLSFEENEEYSYIRENESIKVYANIDDIRDLNYLFFTNNEKRFYAFITSKEYISSECTRLNFNIDILQTYMFDYTIKESFIEREHQDRYILNDDQNKLIPLYNIEKEGIEIGDEYIPTSLNELKPPLIDSQYNYLYFAIVTCSEELAIPQTFYSLKGNEIARDGKIGMTLMNGVPTGCYMYVIPVTLSYGSKLYPNTFTSTNIDIATYNLLGDLMSNTNIVSISLFKNPPINITQNGSNVYCRMSNVSNFRGIMYSSSLIGDCAIIQIKNIPSHYIDWLDIYSVNYDREKALDFLNINNIKSISNEPKFDTNEFSYLQVEIGNNVKQKYNIEDFNDYTTLNFKFLPQVSVNGGTAILPLDYNKDIDYSSMAVFSNILFDLPVVQDAWKQYIAQNKNSLQTGFVTSAIQTASSFGLSAISGGGKGLGGLIATTAISSGVEIASNIARIEDIKATPDKVQKSSLDPFIDLLTDGLKLRVKRFTIKDEFKKKVFKYLYNYGYKTNELKTPNTRSRYYFNYIKTIGCNLIGDLDFDILNQLKNIYNNGITIWHFRDVNTFKGVNNYEYENVEMNILNMGG